MNHKGINDVLGELAESNGAKDYLKDRLVEYLESWSDFIEFHARNRTNRILDVEDFKQEVFLKILEVWDNIDEDKCKHISNYLLKIVTNRIMCLCWENNFVMHIPSGSMGIVSDEVKTKAQSRSITPSQTESIPIAYSRGREDFDAVAELDLIDTLEQFDPEGVATEYFMFNMRQREIADKRDVHVTTISRKINKVVESIKECYDGKD